MQQHPLKHLALTSFLGLLFLAGMWGSCARIVAPTGGLKDTLGPELLFSSPRKGAVGIRANSIVLVFDEWIAPNQINQQLLISPVLDNPFQTKIKKNKLTITFDKPLPDSTTINLNFRQAIQDLTEQNKSKDLTIAFSTGPEIDTIAMSGTITHLFTAEKAADVTVGLWPLYDSTTSRQILGASQIDTLSIGRKKPAYATKTGPDGTYILPNLRQGLYFAAAYADANNNLKWDGKAERLAFLAQPSFRLVADTGLSLKLSAIDDQKPKILRQRIEDSVARVETNEGLAGGYGLLEGQTDTLPAQIDKDKKEFVLYPSWPQADTFGIQVHLIDTAGLATDTVLRFVSPKPKAATKRKTDDEAKTAPAPKAIGFAMLPATNMAVVVPAKITFTFAEPILAKARTIKELVYSKRDSGSKAEPLAGSWNPYMTTYTATLTKMAAKGMQILLPSGLLRTVRGTAVTGDTLLLLPTDLETAGLIRGVAKSKGGKHIVQLLGEDGTTVLGERRNAANFEFIGLAPGNYLIRMVIDANDNGRWDAGSFVRRRQPEAIVAPAGPIKVKANWEVEGIEIAE